MPKVKVHLRVAKQGGPRNTHKVVATLKPSRMALITTHGEPLPTVSFAIVLDIDPEAFRQAERVIAELQVGPEQVAVVAEMGP